MSCCLFFWPFFSLSLSLAHTHTDWDHLHLDCEGRTQIGLLAIAVLILHIPLYFFVVIWLIEDFVAIFIWWDVQYSFHALSLPNGLIKKLPQWKHDVSL